MRRLLRQGLAAGALLAASLPAWGAPSCALLGAPELNFGAYSALGGVRDADATLLLSCTPDPLVAPTVSYTISLSPGSGSPAGYFPRRLAFGSHGLDYNVYVDAAHAVVWGDGTAGTGVVGGTCAGACAVPVYGRIAPGQSVPAGQYRDEVLVIVDF